MAHLDEARESVGDQANVHLSNCSSSDDGVGVVKGDQVLECFASDFVLVSVFLQLPSPHSSVSDSSDDTKERQCYEQIEDRATP